MILDTYPKFIEEKTNVRMEGRLNTLDSPEGMELGRIDITLYDSSRMSISSFCVASSTPITAASESDRKRPMAFDPIHILSLAGFNN